MLQILFTELPGMVLALCAGVYSFRYMNLLYRIFFFQLLACVLISILAMTVLVILRTNNMPLNNQWIYNLYMPIETGFLAWAGYEYFKENKEKKFIFIGYAIFLLVFISELVMKGIRVFSNHGYIAESIFVFMICLFMQYLIIFKENYYWYRSPEFWIITGMYLYFGTVIPYISLLHYLQEHYSKINSMLFQYIIVICSQLRYLSLAAGLWLIRRNAVAEKLITK